MNFEAFQNLARLYVVGALEPEEFVEFEKARRDFGAEAEDFLSECDRLNSAFALSLRPSPTKAETKLRLLEKIRASR